MSKTVDEIMAMIPATAYVQQGKFATKLTFDQRCEILAFHRMNVSRALLSEVYGVDRRTITHIYTKKSPHYKKIRDEEARLGTEEFCKEYITEEVALKIAALQTSEGNKADPNKPNKHSNKVAGVNMVKNEYCANEHRVMIEWREDQLYGVGWYYQDLDSANPDQWFHNGPESQMSSQACLRAAKDVVSD